MAMTGPLQTPRFDASTSTYYDKDQEHRPISLPSGSISSTVDFNHHDGFIRPLTPLKPPVQPDVSVIRVGLDDLYRRSSPSSTTRQRFNYNSAEPPVMYRSSTTIYTRDKHSYPNNFGEIQTSSMKNVDDMTRSTTQSSHINIEPLHNQRRFILPTIINHDRTNSGFYEKEIDHNDGLEGEKYQMTNGYPRQQPSYYSPQYLSHEYSRKPI
mgnify:CR=1 FL=1